MKLKAAEEAEKLALEAAKNVEVDDTPKTETPQTVETKEPEVAANESEAEAVASAAGEEIDPTTFSVRVTREGEGEPLKKFDIGSFHYTGMFLN